jgi:hypothetical protein
MLITRRAGLFKSQWLRKSECSDAAAAAGGVGKGTEGSASGRSAVTRNRERRKAISDSSPSRKKKRNHPRNCYLYSMRGDGERLKIHLLSNSVYNRISAKQLIKNKIDFAYHTSTQYSI